MSLFNQVLRNMRDEETMTGKTRCFYAYVKWRMDGYVAVSLGKKGQPNGNNWKGSQEACLPGLFTASLHSACSPGTGPATCHWGSSGVKREQRVTFLLRLPLRKWSSSFYHSPWGSEILVSVTCFGETEGLAGEWRRSETPLFSSFPLSWLKALSVSENHTLGYWLLNLTSGSFSLS